MTSEALADVAPSTPAPTGSHRARSRVEPLSSERYRVQFTADRELQDKLDLVTDLMVHRNPGRDLAPIVQQALDLLIEKLKKERFAATSRPRRSTRSAKPGRVTNASKREVTARDGLQCSFVDEHGKRCQARGMLEFDHRHPRGQGGGSEPENLRILCRAHNQYLAELAYGRAHIQQARRSRESTRDVAEPARGSEPPRCVPD